MADKTDKQAQLEAQLARMQATRRALDAGDSPEVRVNKTLKTLAEIDRYAGKGDSRKSGPDGIITGEEMAAYVVEQYKAQGGSEKQIRDDIAAIETYQDLKARWTAQKGEKGSVTATMVGKASEADEQAWQRISALMQDEPQRLQYNLKLIAADNDKLKAEQARQNTAPVPDQDAAYKATVAGIMAPMNADPRVRAEQDKQAAKVDEKLSGIEAKAASKIGAANDKGTQKMLEAAQANAERLRAAGHSAEADKYLAQVTQVIERNRQQMPQQAREVLSAGMAEQGQEMKRGAAEAMGRAATAPTRDAPDPNAALKAALAGEQFSKALKYKGHIEPLSLGDLKHAVSQGQAAAPVKGVRE